MGLFLAGLLIGGVDVVDRQEDFVWFLGEALVGPAAFGVDAYHQHMLKAYDPEKLARGILVKRSAHPDETRIVEKRDVYDPALRTTRSMEVPTFRLQAPGERPPNSKSVGRVNELGTLFCTITGMLNLICIIDALFRARAEPVPGAGGPAV
jgi:hypothetical protein